MIASSSSSVNWSAKQKNDKQINKGREKRGAGRRTIFPLAVFDAASQLTERLEETRIRMTRPLTGLYLFKWVIKYASLSVNRSLDWFVSLTQPVEQSQVRQSVGCSL